MTVRLKVYTFYKQETLHVALEVRSNFFCFDTNQVQFGVTQVYLTTPGNLKEDVLRLRKARLKENHKVDKGLRETCTALGSFRMTFDVQHKLTHHAHSASIPETRAYFCKKKSMGSKVKQKSRKKVTVNPLLSWRGNKRSLNIVGLLFLRDLRIYR